MKKKDKIYFAIALHFHQPVGNFDYVFERAYKLCYKPFLDALLKYPHFKMMFHVSGSLLDYLDESHPEAIKLIRQLISRRQVEIMGGGYYEPIFTATPEEDIKGQIKMMSEYIRHKFDAVPQGMWLPERIWDPKITKPIYESGLRYLILDDEHLLRSGLKQDEIHGYFLTGKGKEKVAVFPSNKDLRYMIPFKLPQETLNYFKRYAKAQPGILFTYGDDGEKFGEWPGTNKWVFKEGWLRKFFDMLEQNKAWIELVHFSEYLKEHKPTGALTIQQGSYKEMMEWSGDSWMNFLSKYPEAGHMHKKMMLVSSKFQKIKGMLEEKKLSSGGVPGLLEAKVARAQKHLYMGECNCAYWHGVFGGLYLYHLRRAVYQHLIKAEKIIDSLLHEGKKQWFDIQQLDFDGDGEKEVIMEDEYFSITVDPMEGGIIKEIDYKPASFNLVNTLARKKESYHQKILNFGMPKGTAEISTIHNDFRPIDPALRDRLVYDKFSRYFLRSYFIKKGVSLESFISSSYEELGTFAQGSYEVEMKGKAVILRRKGSLSGIPVVVSKQIQIESDEEIEILCEVEKKSALKSKVFLGLEFNFTMPDLNAPRYYYYFDKKRIESLNAQGSISKVSSFGVEDTAKKFRLHFRPSRKPFIIWYFPVRTVSQSEKAYELNYQCSCIVALWDLNLKAGSHTFDINLVFESD